MLEEFALSSELRITVECTIAGPDLDARCCSRAGADSEIVREGLLRPDDLPAGQWRELYGLRQVDSRGRADLAEVRRITRWLLAIHSVAGGGGSCPLLAICGRNHAAFYVRFLGREYDVTVLRGSLRPGNPYPPLELMHQQTGGSDDEHVVMFRIRKGVSDGTP